MKTFDLINPVTRLNAPYLCDSLHVNGFHERISYRGYLESISSLTVRRNALWEFRRKLKIWKSLRPEQHYQL